MTVIFPVLILGCVIFAGYAGQCQALNYPPKAGGRRDSPGRRKGLLLEQVLALATILGQGLLLVPPQGFDFGGRQAKAVCK